MLHRSLTDAGRLAVRGSFRRAPPERQAPPIRTRGPAPPKTGCARAGRAP